MYQFKLKLNSIFSACIVFILFSCNEKECKIENEKFQLMPYSSNIDNQHEYHFREEHFLVEGACQTLSLEQEVVRLERVDSFIYEHIKDIEWWKYEYIGFYFYQNSSCIKSHKTRIRFDEQQLYRDDDGCGSDLIWKYSFSIDKKNKKIKELYVFGINGFFHFLLNETRISRESLKEKFNKKM